ncbi:PAS domain-containing sensor histidine kinase [Hymenobacter pini]|uniref:PAS domain-containing sensor histidine kinase n=1 Tax=Hymenobacter pini TaxID=2880879 RepID=UPI001CF3F283|nr:PAS domain-containing protein [Hymenobacter pini]MCA8831610.1 PAS domain-containing protein [Hymenobacter pini]
MSAQSASIPPGLPPDFLSVLLEETVAGVLYLVPDAAPDFAVAYSNQTARKLLGPLAEPGQLLSQWPVAAPARYLLVLLQEAHEQSQRQQQLFMLNLPSGSLPFRLIVRRVGGGLLLSCLPADSPELAAAQTAQRQSEARESAAYAEANRQREQLYHLLEQAPSMICVLSGPEHVFQFVNSNYAASLGNRPLLGLPIEVAVPGIQGHPVMALLNQVYQTGETYTAHEMPVQLRAEGPGQAKPEQYYYNFIYQARRNQQGQVDGIYVFAYDVTPQVQARQQIEWQNEQLAKRVEEGMQAAEQEREKQQADLQRIFEQAPVAIAIMRGPEFIVEQANAAIGTIWGRWPADTLGRPYFEAVAETAGQGFEEILDEVMRSGKPHLLNETPVIFNRSHTGQPAQAYINFVLQPLRSLQQEVTGVIVIGTEVTEQVQSRQLQQVQQQLLDGLFLDAPAPIAILAGPDMVYQLVNPAYQQLFPGRELLNRPLLEALPELLDTPVPELLRQVYATGETYVAREMELRLARQPGNLLETAYFTFTYQARRSAEGLVNGVLVFAYDVTQQVQARLVLEDSQVQTQLLADELQKTNTQLIRANADLDTFVYMASHDLKAPITNIDGLLQALRHELALPATEADTETVLRLMQDSVQRFQRTIKYLTDVSRWQQVQDLPASSVAVAELVADVCRDLAPLLAVTNGQVQVAADSCPELLFAEKHLRSLLYNLISNALKYRSPERVPLVQVRCTLPEPGMAVLEVQDNGLGLTPEQQQRVFGMFQRLHDHVEGSGIGLYLAKQVVEKAGGQLSVESQQGVGSTFRAILPQPTIQ